MAGAARITKYARSVRGSLKNNNCRDKQFFRRGAGNDRRGCLWKVVTGDFVQVIAGQDKGKTGNVLDVLRRTSELIVEDVNVEVKKVPVSEQNPVPAFVRVPRPIHASNVALIHPKSDRPTRVKFQTQAILDAAGVATGKRQRLRWATGMRSSGSASPLQDYEIPKPDPTTVRGPKPENGPFDTPLSVVARVSFSPDPAKRPIPGRRLNWNSRIGFL